MDRLPLIGGSYSARSTIANAQRCVNYYPELNRTDAPVPFTYYQRPGLRPKAQGEVAPVRGLYQASNGNGYAVCGQTVYAIGPDWEMNSLGTLNVPGSNPISFIDNGEVAWLVDNSIYGYSIDLTSNDFAVVADPTGSFAGATKVDYLDTFMLWNLPGTRFFGSTLSNSLSFDALFVAGKAGYPDPLQTLVVNKREIILFGSLKSEIWYDAGNTGFPFAELPGAYIEHGCAAKYSVATTDIQTLWLGRDLKGLGVVFSLRGYDTRRVSNHAIEYAISKMADISDAIGYTYQQSGHVFYVLTFPSANQTWVYDLSLESDPTMAWHQRCWTDRNGNLQRHRGMSSAFINGLNVVGDWENGIIYEQALDSFVDTVEDVDYAMSCIKGFPHVLSGASPKGTGQKVLANGAIIQIGKFIADIEAGGAPLEGNSSIGLAWSIDRGKTFQTELLQSDGLTGEYFAQPQWPSTVMARDLVCEIRHSIAGPVALNSAWIEATVLPNP